MKEKIGRNDPCPCKSGKKYKVCCGQKSASALGKRKFTAKVLSAGGVHKPPAPQQAVQQPIKPVDYNLLMERSFGEALHSHEERPPLPQDPSEYLLPAESEETPS